MERLRRGTVRLWEEIEALPATDVSHEFANIVHVVRKSFAVDDSTIPADVLSFVRGMD
jgi:hypothetical protein